MKDFSGLIAKAAAASFEAAKNRSRFEPLPVDAFPAASLTAWSALAQAAGVPMVPVEVVGSVNVDDVLHFETPEAPGVQAALDLLESHNAALTENTMLRWDCCASFGVKSALSDGKNPKVSDRGLFADDPRAFDILYDYPAKEIALLRRPWVKAMQVDGYPLEFRVFVDEGAPVAIANYYLQRPLADGPDIRALAVQALSYSQAILDQLAITGKKPLAPGQLPDSGLAATLDFMVDDTGQLLFLEAGPGLGYRAHLCAFFDPNTNKVAPVEGLCLASGVDAIPLAELPRMSSATTLSRPGSCRP